MPAKGNSHLGEFSMVIKKASTKKQLLRRWVRPGRMPGNLKVRDYAESARLGVMLEGPCVKLVCSMVPTMLERFLWVRDG